MSAHVEVFSGEWTVECLWSGLWYKTFTIEDSLASDGIYELGWNWTFDATGTGVLLNTPPIAVSGPRWRIWFEWRGRLEPDTSLHRSNAVYTLQDGLVVDLLSDNRSVFGTDAGLRPFDSASLRCYNVDPKLNFGRPFVPSYDFTIPRSRVRDPIVPPRQPTR